MKKLLLKILLNACLIVTINTIAVAQRVPKPDLSRNNSPNGQVTTDNQGRPVKKNNDNDSLKRRDIHEDSITIFYRSFDSTRIRLLDSSIHDFYTRFPVPYHYIDAGNFGNAARSLLFNPIMKPGWDAGFHAYDIYRFTVEDTRFFQTTRPYTELGYLLGSKAEQLINILHTQNQKSNLNFAFQYRLISSPGAFRNQNTNHNNIRLNLAYQGRNKRYSNYIIYLSNKLRASENGGLRNEDQLDSLSLNDPFELETRLGSNNVISRNFFSTNINTGTAYDENTLLIRQQYDFGTKDSLVTDSTTYQLFYPRIRLQHNLLYSKNSYSFLDNQAVDSLYQLFFNYSASNDTISFKDVWTKLSNEFNIISFPEKNNLNQFLKVGAGWELIKGENFTNVIDLNNIYILGEYRNRTRNQIWDVEANGKFYAAGPLAGDYFAAINLKRLLGKKLGFLALGFTNVNRSPSYNYKGYTSFPLQAVANLSKENTTKFFAAVDMPAQNFRLTGNYYILKNYIYSDSFFTVNQQSALFNIIQVSAEKIFKLSKHLHLYSELHVQQAIGEMPVNIPLILTRQRLAFEGNFFRNLFLSTGLELRYSTNYKPANYSPFTGQFFYQDVYSVSNRPDIHYFLHFRIKSFKSFIRVENLNSFTLKDNPGFNKRNFTMLHYPSQSLWLRVGIWWSFVN